MLTSISSRWTSGCAQSDFTGESNFHEDKKQFFHEDKKLFFFVSQSKLTAKKHETRHGNLKMPRTTTQTSCVFWISFTYDNVHPLETTGWCQFYCGRRGFLISPNLSNSKFNFFAQIVENRTKKHHRQNLANFHTLLGLQVGVHEIRAKRLRQKIKFYLG